MFGQGPACRPGAVAFGAELFGDELFGAGDEVADDSELFADPEVAAAEPPEVAAAAIPAPAPSPATATAAPTASRGSIPADRARDINALLPRSGMPLLASGTATLTGEPGPRLPRTSQPRINRRRRLRAR